MKEGARKLGTSYPENEVTLKVVWNVQEKLKKLRENYDEIYKELFDEANSVVFNIQNQGDVFLDYKKLSIKNYDQIEKYGLHNEDNLKEFLDICKEKNAGEYKKLFEIMREARILRGEAENGIYEKGLKERIGFEKPFLPTSTKNILREATRNKIFIVPNEEIKKICEDYAHGLDLRREDLKFEIGK
jgi:hypothetical protein